MNERSVVIMGYFRLNSVDKVSDSSSESVCVCVCFSIGIWYLGRRYLFDKVGVLYSANAILRKTVDTSCFWNYYKFTFKKRRTKEEETWFYTNHKMLTSDSYTHGSWAEVCMEVS